MRFDFLWTLQSSCSGNLCVATLLHTFALSPFCSWPPLPLQPSLLQLVSLFPLSWPLQELLSSCTSATVLDQAQRCLTSPIDSGVTMMCMEWSWQNHWPRWSFACSTWSSASLGNLFPAWPFRASAVLQRISTTSALPSFLATSSGIWLIRPDNTRSTAVYPTRVSF